MPTVIGNGAAPPEVAAAVLLAVLVTGVLAGRAKGRVTLLVAGVVAVVAAGIATTAMTTPPGADRAAQLTTLYAVALPLAVVFVAGWLCGRGSWLKRLVVIAVAAVLLAALPYAELGRASAPALFPGG
jgi:hypothetical protein